jgi:hypothetical protein
MYLGDSLYYKLWDDSQVDNSVDQIAKLLGDSVKNKNISAASAKANDATVAPSASVASAAPSAAAGGGGAPAVHAIKAANLQNLEELDISGVIELFHTQFKFTAYDDILKENEISGAVLLYVTAEDLVEIGVKKIHSNVIVRRVAALL